MENADCCFSAPRVKNRQLKGDNIHEEPSISTSAVLLAAPLALYAQSNGTANTTTQPTTEPVTIAKADPAPGNGGLMNSTTGQVGNNLAIVPSAKKHTKTRWQSDDPQVDRLQLFRMIRGQTSE